jgi:hypothetical protein
MILAKNMASPLSVTSVLSNKNIFAHPFLREKEVQYIFQKKVAESLLPDDPI